LPSAFEILAAQTSVIPRDILLTSQSAPPSRSVARLPDRSRLPLTSGAIETYASSPTNGTASAKATASANATVSAAEDNEDAGQVVADSLIASLELAEEGSAIHTAIKAALECHVALMATNLQNIKVAKNASRGEAQVIHELLRRLKSSSLSDDDDESNDSPE
jgi:hypothetical protein